MLKQFLNQVSSQRFLQIPALGLLLALGFATKGVSLEAPKTSQLNRSNNSILAAKILNVQVPDGTYLYGRSPQPEEIGNEYMVFEARQGKVVGAFYMPASEFACFHGTLDSQKMSLNVVDPYEKTTSAYAILIENNSRVATTGGSLPSPKSFGLEGYYPIKQVSTNDQRILNTCKADYQ